MKRIIFVAVLLFIAFAANSQWKLPQNKLPYLFQNDQGTYLGGFYDIQKDTAKISIFKTFPVYNYTMDDFSITYIYLYVNPKLREGNLNYNKVKLTYSNGEVIKSKGVLKLNGGSGSLTISYAFSSIDISNFLQWDITKITLYDKDGNYLDVDMSGFDIDELRLAYYDLERMNDAEFKDYCNRPGQLKPEEEVAQKQNQESTPKPTQKVENKSTDRKTIEDFKASMPTGLSYKSRYDFYVGSYLQFQGNVGFEIIRASDSWGFDKKAVMSANIMLIQDNVKNSWETVPGIVKDNIIYDDVYVKFADGTVLSDLYNTSHCKNGLGFTIIELQLDNAAKIKTSNIVKVRFFDRDTENTVDIDMTKFDMDVFRTNYKLLENMDYEQLKLKCSGKDKGMEGF